jgi:hypothetical protein
MWGTGPSGEAFDVTLQDAQANDMPERFQAKVYFHPGLFTIPQFNARFGKRIAPNLWVSAGWDHMKYKLKKQWVVAEGYADASDMGLEDEFPAGTIAEWNGDSLWWGQGFNLEHSDGMNFVRFSLEHQTDLWRSVNDQFMLSVFEAVGVGVVVCSTFQAWGLGCTRDSECRCTGGFSSRLRGMWAESHCLGFGFKGRVTRGRSNGSGLLRLLLRLATSLARTINPKASGIAIPAQRGRNCL